MFEFSEGKKLDKSFFYLLGKNILQLFLEHEYEFSYFLDKSKDYILQKSTQIHIFNTMQDKKSFIQPPFVIEVQFVHGNEFCLFWDKAFPLLFMSRTRHSSSRNH